MAEFVPPLNAPLSASFMPPKKLPRRPSGENWIEAMKHPEKHFDDMTPPEIAPTYSKVETPSIPFPESSHLPTHSPPFSRIKIKDSPTKSEETIVEMIEAELSPQSDEPAFFPKPFHNEPTPFLNSRSVTSPSADFSQSSLPEFSAKKTPVPLRPWELVILSNSTDHKGKLARLQDLVAFCSPSEVKQFIKDVLIQFPAQPWNQQYLFFILKMSLLCQTEVFVTTFQANDVELLFSRGVDEDAAGEFLLFYLTFKALHLQNATTNPLCLGFSEATALLNLCMKRNNGRPIFDQREILPSNLRDWLCRIWYDLPSTRIQKPHLIELMLHWINQPVHLIDKEPCFHLLRRELEYLGFEAGYIWLLSSFIDFVDRQQGTAHQHLQFVLFLIPREKLAEIPRRLLNSSGIEPSVALRVWCHFILFTWLPLPLPNYLEVYDSSKTYGTPASPLFDFMAYFLRAFYHFSPSKNKSSQSIKQIRLSLVECALRINAAKASSPLNSQESLQLLVHLVATGPCPVSRIKGAGHVLISLISFYERLHFLYKGSLSIAPKLLEFLGDTVTLLKHLIQYDTQAIRDETKNELWWISSEQNTNRTAEAIQVVQNKLSVDSKLKTTKIQVPVLSNEKEKIVDSKEKNPPVGDEFHTNTKQIAMILSYLKSINLLRLDHPGIGKPEGASSFQLPSKFTTFSSTSPPESPKKTKDRGNEAPTKIEQSIQTEVEVSLPKETKEAIEETPPTPPPPPPPPPALQAVTEEPMVMASVPNFPYAPQLPDAYFNPMENFEAQMFPPYFYPSYPQPEMELPIVQDFTFEEEEVKPPSPKYLSLKFSSVGCQKIHKFHKQTTGLRNLGNTCYMNSILQAFFLTTCFLTNIMHFKMSKPKKNSSVYDNPDKDVMKKLRQLMAHMAITKRSYVNPRAFRSKCKSQFADSNEQQDAVEFAHYLFLALGGQEQELIRMVFGGEIAQKVKCRRCGRVSERKEVIHDMGLFLTSPGISKKKHLDVETLMAESVKKETLEGQNQYKCEKCSKLVDADKWTEIVSPPAHMFVVLNRYSWDLYGEGKKKIATHVEINKKLELLSFHYELYAVVIHRGPTASSGHYYTIGRRSEGKGKWYKFDDSTVTESSYSEINRLSESKNTDDAPYALLYRCSEAPPSPPLYIPDKYYAMSKKDDGSDQRD
eukprot:GHVP01065628.1.p1 GENE.GHVP01065628.1~~GHVP01065628.1.p1  ORF type:complete len:1171 (+),score=210.98 GHVP01065628.1:4000-7512(+)